MWCVCVCVCVERGEEGESVGECDASTWSVISRAHRTLVICLQLWHAETGGQRVVFLPLVAFGWQCEAL